LEKELERYYNKGVSALEDGNWLLAVQYFRKCIEMDSKYSPAYHELADIYYQNGQLEAATAVLKDALLLDPKDMEATFALGSVYLSQGRHTDALRVFKRLETEAPEFAPELYYNIGICYKNLDKPVLALEYMELAIEDDPSYFECLEVIGKLHLDAGRLPQAKKALLELLESDPGNIGAHHTLGVVYSKEQNWGQAIEEWETVLKLAPNTDEALRELGWALNMVGDYEKAVTSLKKAIEMNPHNLQARIDLGAVFMSNLKFEEAINEWELARTDDPGNPLIKKFLSDAQALRRSKEGKSGD
jgi:tetratricopeptide (TPR) repeat protein